MWKFPENAEPSAWLTDVNSVLVSAVCHMTVLVMLGMASLYGYEQSGAKVPELTVELADSGDLPDREEVASSAATGADAIAAGDAAEPQIKEAATELDPQPLPTGEMASNLNPAQFEPNLAAGEIFDEAAARAALDNSLLTKGEKGGIGPGKVGRGKGGGGDLDEGEANFFGVSGYGQVFVYVVDCSGSMADDGKFERARYELLHSIEQLNEDQRYYVIFYNHRTFPMEAKEPVVATPKEFEKTRRWIDHAAPDGRTAPLHALVQALSFKPDAVYFLSDGLFDPQTIHELRARNRHPRKRPIPIHTIAFVNHEAEGQMQMIARNSGGEYRFVE